MGKTVTCLFMSFVLLTIILILFNFSIAEAMDTDNDGLNDFYEIIKDTNPRFPDSDGDGWLDKAEIDAGSDPKNHTSTPKNP